MKRLILFSAFFLITACGSDGDDAPGNKGITALWTNATNSFSFDASAFTLPVTGGAMTFIFTGGERCDCTVDVIGTEAAGNYVLSSCGYTSGGAGDPGCASINSSGSYEAQGTNMELCDSGGCVLYH